MIHFECFELISGKGCILPTTPAKATHPLLAPPLSGENNLLEGGVPLWGGVVGIKTES